MDSINIEKISIFLERLALVFCLIVEDIGKILSEQNFISGPFFCLNNGLFRDSFGKTH